MSEESDQVTDDRQSHDRLTRMIAAQLDVQHAVATSPLELSGDDRIEYIRMNTLALFSEINEMLQEIGWKSWSTSCHVNEDEAFGELRDAWQFLTNLMLAVTQLSPAELAQRLESTLYAKHAVNRDRQSSGYDGVAGKCSRCKRDLAEMVSNRPYVLDGKIVCALCAESEAYRFKSPGSS